MPRFKVEVVFNAAPDVIAEYKAEQISWESPSDDVAVLCMELVVGENVYIPLTSICNYKVTELGG